MCTACSQLVSPCVSMRTLLFFVEFSLYSEQNEMNELLFSVCVFLLMFCLLHVNLYKFCMIILWCLLSFSHAIQIYSILLHIFVLIFVLSRV